MRHLYFVTPTKSLSPGSLGLEPGRLYAMVGMVKINVDKSTYHLCVVHNPYVKADKRDVKQLWSKAWLADDTKNKKYIDCIVKGYGQAVYEFVKDPLSNVYLYDFL